MCRMLGLLITLGALAAVYVPCQLMLHKVSALLGSPVGEVGQATTSKVRGPYTAYAAATWSRPVVPSSLSPFQTPKMLPTFLDSQWKPVKPACACQSFGDAPLSGAHRPVGAYDAAAVQRVESDLTCRSKGPLVCTQGRCIFRMCAEQVAAGMGLAPSSPNAPSNCCRPGSAHLSSPPSWHTQLHRSCAARQTRPGLPRHLPQPADRQMC